MACKASIRDVWAFQTSGAFRASHRVSTRSLPSQSRSRRKPGHVRAQSERPDPGPSSQPQAFHRMEDMLRGRLIASKTSRWKRVDDSFVLLPHAVEPSALVHFVGGAFVGAAPQLAYSAILEELAAAGVVVVATPYHTGFDITWIADDVHFKFERAVKSLGRRMLDLPVFGVGHSLGSTVHLVLASRYAVSNQGNILLSYNNNSVAHSIPLLASMLMPGTQIMGPLFVQLAASTVQSNVQKMFQHLKGQSPEVIQQLSPLLEQLVSIYGDIVRGTREFSPTHAEARSMIREGYCVERTLLIQFESDPVDDTLQLSETLQTGAMAGLAEVTCMRLPGNHLRPLQQQLAKLLPPDSSRWASTARTQSEAFIDQLLDAAGGVGAPGETRNGLERLAKAATGFAGALGDALSKASGGVQDPAAATGKGQPSDLARECIEFMSPEQRGVD